MQEIELFNFQDLIIKNIQTTNTPSTQTKKAKKDLLTVVIIRDPYEYFDYLLFDYLNKKKSLLFTDDIIEHMKKMSNHDFLIWLKRLNFIPFLNPQTFQMDVRKRVDFAIENLERFDYVVPYEEINRFLENTSLGISIKKLKEQKNDFSLSLVEDGELVKEFIGKDMELYAKTKELWDLIKSNDYRPLSDLIKRKAVYINIKEAEDFKGASGIIHEKMIRGYALNVESQESLSLEIYKNGKLLCTTKADIVREGIMKQFDLTSGKCGFQVNFDKPTFKKGDSVDVIIVPENIRLPIVGNAKKFLDLGL